VVGKFLLGDQFDFGARRRWLRVHAQLFRVNGFIQVSIRQSLCYDHDSFCWCFFHHQVVTNGDKLYSRSCFKLLC
jgi:hypothetical protein